MSGDKRHHSPDDAGLRRRRSAHHDGDDYSAAGASSDSPGPGTNVISSVRSATQSSRPIGSEKDGSIPVSHELMGPVQGTRLSLDTDTESPRHIPKETLSGGARTQVDEAVPAQRSQNMFPDGSGMASDRASRVGSSVASSNAQAPSQSSPATQRGRQRGYSLRSALFQRNIRDTPSGAPSAGIEMSKVGPKNGHRRQASAQSTRLQTGKKGVDTIVEVSPTEYSEWEEESKIQDLERHAGIKSAIALPKGQSWYRGLPHDPPAWRHVNEVLARMKKIVLRTQEIPPSQDGRHISLDPSRETALVDERTGKIYIPNSIRSSRYNAWNFVPRQLFAQFSKLANFYFLCVSILQMIPGLSTTGSKYTKGFTTFRIQPLTSTQLIPLLCHYFFLLPFLWRRKGMMIYDVTDSTRSRTIVKLMCFSNTTRQEGLNTQKS